MIEIEPGRALWVYRDEDKEFLPRLEQALKESGFPRCRLWETKPRAAKYVQYLCSVHLNQLIAGDIVHFWRDGQTWWPCSGDYSLDDEEKAERILREALCKFSEEKRR